MSPRSRSMAPGKEVLLNGSPLSGAADGRLIDIRVDDSLLLPDSCVIRIADNNDRQFVDSLFTLGAEVEVKLAGPEDNRLESAFKGLVYTLEPTFGAGDIVVSARCYDRGYELTRGRKTRTFMNMTASDIASQIAGEYGLSGKTDSSGASFPFMQQTTETDWHFLWRLAARIDFVVFVDGRDLNFKKADVNRGQATLKWGETLLSFSPRVTGAQQPQEVKVRAWDRKEKRELLGTATSPTLDSKIGVGRNDAVKAGGQQPKVALGHLPGETVDEMNKLAESVMSHLANAYVMGEGTCIGNPKVKAGAKLQIEEVGTRHKGTYTCSGSTHLFRGEKGYETRFKISGRTPQTYVDLSSPAPKSTWSAGVVVAKVADIADPDKLGRVKVEYGDLQDSSGSGIQSFWARVATLATGKDRGVFMQPIVNEEVLVAFEHGDARRPYVIGSVWNTKDTPGKIADKDGSFVIKSDKFVNVTSKDNIDFKGDKQFALTTKDNIAVKGSKDYVLETSGKITQKAGGDIMVQGSAKITVKAGTSLLIEGGTDVTIKAGGGQISMKPGGMVEVSGTKVSVKGSGMVELQGAIVKIN